MVEAAMPRVAIIDLGLGNLFSIGQACRCSGLESVISASLAELRAADALILPGVGAFADAMQALREKKLEEPLKELILSGKPFIGICLGMQLLLSESREFGRHRGLGIIPGRVERLASTGPSPEETVKVPHVGWNRIHQTQSWRGSLLDGIAEGSDMYFVHSFHAAPDEPGVVLAYTEYGSNTFCSALRKDNIFACQFHPERSGQEGLRMYRNIAAFIVSSRERINEPAA